MTGIARSLDDRCNDASHSPDRGPSVAVVTGAGSGIGRAVARRLAGEDALVLCVDIDAADAEETARSIRAAGFEARSHGADIGSREAVEEMVDTAAEHGSLATLVNNASVQVEQRLALMSDVDWDRILQVNVSGTFYCCRAAIGKMAPAGRGSIVNVGSVNAFWSEDGLAAYSATKAAILALTRGVALEVGAAGVRCNSISPGYIDTGMAQRYFDSQPDPAAARAAAMRLQPLGRLGAAEEVAEVAAFLASDAASFCTGQNFVVDGGLTIGSVPLEPEAGE